MLSGDTHKWQAGHKIEEASFYLGERYKMFDGFEIFKPTAILLIDFQDCSVLIMPF